MPRPRGTDNYVGIEIECFGLMKRSNLTTELNKKIRGKFDIVNEYLTPDPIRPVEGDIKLSQGPSKIIKVKYKPTEHYVSSNDLIEVRGKEGLFFNKTIIPYCIEQVYNGRSWTPNGVTLPASPSYVSGNNSYNSLNIPHYKGLKTYFCTSARQETYEIRLLCKQKEINTIIKKTYDVLNENNIKVNKSCGLHVHLDMRNRDKDVCYKNLFMCQDLLMKVHPSRKGSRWCKKNTKNTFLRQQQGGGRYSVINAESYRKHKTLEIRLGAATTDGAKVLAWVRMLCNIVDKKSVLRENIKTTTKYLNKFKMADTHTKIIKAMQRKPRTTRRAA